MLNVEVNRSADGVERYFDRALAVSDYLMKEPDGMKGCPQTTSEGQFPGSRQRHSLSLSQSVRGDV